MVNHCSTVTRKLVQTNENGFITLRNTYSSAEVGAVRPVRSVVVGTLLQNTAEHGCENFTIFTDLTDRDAI